LTPIIEDKCCAQGILDHMFVDIICNVELC